MALRIHLPDFNGSVSAGLAPIGDHSLSRDEQLVVPGSLNAKENATQDMVDEIIEWVGPAGISNSTTIILATKLAFWQTNNHTGAGAPNPYIVKVIATVLPKVAVVEAVKYVHLAGHWASTHVCLNILGIHVNAPFVSNLRFSHQYKINVADNFKLRQDTMPARTAKDALCDAVVKKFVTNRIWALLPPSDFAQLMDCCKAVSDLRDKARVVMAANMDKRMAEKSEFYNENL